MKESKISIGAGIGLLAGIIIGSATDNVGLWIALGLCFGAGIGTTLEKKTKWKNYQYSYLLWHLFIQQFLGLTMLFSHFLYFI